MAYLTRAAQIQATVRRGKAERALAGCPFVIAPPLRVEEFTGMNIPLGYSINTQHAGRRTDFHIVDARGRTVIRFVHNRAGSSALKYRRRQAAWHCDEMNAALEREAVQAAREKVS